MPDPGNIYPFRDGDVSKETSLFRHDPQNPPVPRMPARVGPESLAFRRQRSISEFYREWFNEQNKSLSDLYEPRLRNVWRIVRTLAIARGVVMKKSQTLEAATTVHPSPWIEPFHFYAREGTDQFVNAICKARMLPLLPPDIPALHLNGRVDAGYDPEQDEPLFDFIRLAEHVATRVLFIPRTKEGVQGLAGLFDPRIARLAWPSPPEIMAYEHELVRKTYATLISTDSGGGDQEAEAGLRAKDFSQAEILQVLAMARAHALVATGLDDPETFFHFEVARLKELAQRQSRREDFRGAAQTIRDVLRLVANRDKGDGDEDYDSIVEAEMVKDQKRLPKPDEDGILDA